jgi:drug/metabolite transporter (DMT)-like permease
VIFNVSSVFTYFLSLFLLSEPFSVIKLTGVFATFGGAALIAFSDKLVVPLVQDTVSAGMPQTSYFKLDCF